MNIAAALFFLLLTSPFVSAVDMSMDDPPSMNYDYSLLRKAEAANYSRLMRPEVTLLDSLHSYDVLHYQIYNTLNESAGTTSGRTIVSASAVEAPLDSVGFDFIGMTVDSVRLNSQPATYRRANNKLWVTTPGYPSGEHFVVDVFYHGHPSRGMYFQNNRYGTLMTFTFTEPWDSRYWYPCFDEPFDKATSETFTRVSSGKYVVSNGSLVEVTDHGDGTRTYHWSTNHPISTYLISFAVFDYAIITNYAHINGDSVPVQYYVYHADSASAAYDLANTPDMVEHYSTLVIPYPFMNEKYSVVQTSIFGGWGAMEHQTCTTYGDGLIDGHRTYEWIDAHELAHMWFGDHVTCADFRNIWLNEGFATYFDALYSEYKYGESTFQSRMQQNASSYFYEDAQIRYPIYDPPPDYIFGAVEYEKGAWVLHMLRNIVGDSCFFQALRDYSFDYSYGNAVTSELQAQFEESSGTDLDWFFNEWVYNQGHPEYRWAWAQEQQGDHYVLTIYIAQVQANAPMFTMPIELKVRRYNSTDTTVTIWNNAQYQLSYFNFADRPTLVQFDPGNKILKVAQRQTGIPDANNVLPAGFALSQNYPNPFNPVTNIDFTVGAESDVALAVYDMTGQVVRRLAAGRYSPGAYTLQWDGTDDAGRKVASAVYFYKLTAGDNWAVKKMTLLK